MYYSHFDHSAMSRLIVTLIVLCLFGDAVAAEVTERLVIGVFPRRQVSETVQMFTPLADYLSKRLGRPVTVEPAKDFTAFWDGIARQHYQIAHMNPLQYVKGHREFGYQAILKNEERGETTIAGTIVVHRNSGIESLAQLKGKRIAFGGNRDAIVSYGLPTLLLRRAGLKDGDYTEIFVKNPYNAVTLVYVGEADASGSSDFVLRPGFTPPNVDAQQLKIIARTQALPQLPWAVSKQVNASLRLQIQTLLAHLRDDAEGRAILANAQLTGLVPTSDAEYDSYRHLLKDQIHDPR